VRLVALNLRVISGWIWMVLWWILGFRDFSVHITRCQLPEVDREYLGFWADIHVGRGVSEVPNGVTFMQVYGRISILVMFVSESPHFQEVTTNGHSCQVGSPGLSHASGFEHPASTLPTRFPAALGIGYGPACGLANACALVYVAA